MTLRNIAILKMYATRAAQDTARDAAQVCNSKLVGCEWLLIFISDIWWPWYNAVRHGEIH